MTKHLPVNYTLYVRYDIFCSKSGRFFCVFLTEFVFKYRIEHVFFVKSYLYALILYGIMATMAVRVIRNGPDALTIPSG